MDVWPAERRPEGDSTHYPPPVTKYFTKYEFIVQPMSIFKDISISLQA